MAVLKQLHWQQTITFINSNIATSFYNSTLPPSPVQNNKSKKPIILTIKKKNEIDR